ncbi:Uncharacterised protein [Mycoplasmopsis californica]|uniref:Variable surface lipoprotein n=1 Tax=Mycoplasmopsis equigenitalium TaxID=114883 RepID=A0ABY5J3T1_9BACT|nr:hypothetical protein [Mycoplasmopsis equigenitalium]UUD37181.1 hypothetical protein NPA09_01240 [Mycoplasmopsis equigenitalium]VEU69512.1 Uncharacterised protein [Mycoplasmopsis californica]
MIRVTFATVYYILIKKKTKLILFGLCTVSAIATAIAAVSCNNSNNSENQGNENQGNRNWEAEGTKYIEKIAEVDEDGVSVPINKQISYTKFPKHIKKLLFQTHLMAKK